jgi:hypothetical protein
VATRYFPTLRCEVIAPGIEISRTGAHVTPPPEFTAQRPAHSVAIVGAIGPHKGSALLDELADRLRGTNIGIAVIGYTDSQILRGWRTPRHCYVHGPYVETDLVGLMAAYEVEVAVFPNRLPESFSYTLSEVWAAGIPVIVGDAGALFERVSKHEGGWTLPPLFSAADVELLLRRVFSPAGAEALARVKSQIDPQDPVRIPTLASMSRDIEALYKHFGLEAPPSGQTAAPGDDALRPLLAANLDGFAFRRELIKLADEAVQNRAAVERAKKLELDLREAQAWARKLQRDVDDLTAEVTNRVEENRRLADDRAAFYHLPLIVRKLLLKKEFRARRR